MTMNIQVEYIDSGGVEVYRESIDTLTTLLGVRLNEILVEEASVRPDGESAVYTGALTDSMVILEDEWDMVTVGTNLDYANKLARGLPDPDADFEDIYDWVRIKDLPPKMKKGYRKKSKAQRRFARNVHNKITTEGPIPNPFDERAVAKFMAEWEDIVEEAMF